VFVEIMELSRASGRLTTDAHLATLAIETQSELHSNDLDFARFPGLKWLIFNHTTDIFQQ